MTAHLKEVQQGPPIFEGGQPCARKNNARDIFFMRHRSRSSEHSIKLIILCEELSKAKKEASPRLPAEFRNGVPDPGPQCLACRASARVPPSRLRLEPVAPTAETLDVAAGGPCRKNPFQYDRA